MNIVRESDRSQRRFWVIGGVGLVLCAALIAAGDEATAQTGPTRDGDAAVDSLQAACFRASAGGERGSSLSITPWP